MKKIVVVALIFFNSLVSFADTLMVKNDSIKSGHIYLERYPALLWEVRAPGSSNPSYVYAALETSDKLAFHLTDLFFKSFRSVDYLMLDLHPDSLRVALQDPQILRRIYKGRITTGYSPSDDYYNILNPNEYNRNMFRNILGGQRAYMAHVSDMEEDKSLTDFMYMAALKQRQGILGAMTYPDYLDIQEVSDEVSEEIQEHRRNRRIDFQAYRALIERCYNAYRSGDIGLFDTLYRQLIDFPDYFVRVQEPLRDQLFDGFVVGMEQGSIMAIFDATLIGGRNGLLEQLRKEGYVVTPLPHEILTKPNRRKERLERKTVRIRYSPYTSSDGFWTMNLPVHVHGSFTERGSSSWGVDYLNDVVYSVSRHSTNAQINSRTPEDLYLRMDSMAFENIPGKIIRRRSVNIGGYPGMEILNRTTRGHLEQSRIVITPLEVIAFRVSGPARSIRRKNAARTLLRSATIHHPPQQWDTVTTGHGEFSLLLPSYHTVDSIQNMVFTSPELTYEAWDPETSSYFLFRRNLHHDLLYLEQDTVDLLFMTEHIAEHLEYDPVIEGQGEHDGYPSISFTLKPKHDHNDTLFGMLVLRGAAHYLLLAQVEERAMADRFFNGFQILPFTYHTTSELKTDTVMLFSVMSPVESQDPKEEDRGLAYLFGLIDDSDVEDISYLADNAELSWFYDQGGEYIHLNREKVHDYQGYSSFAHLWYTLLAEPFGHDSTFTIHKFEQDSTALFPWMDVTLRAPGTIRQIRQRHLLHHGLIYTLSTMYDTLNGEMSFTSEFFDTFTPLEDTLAGRSVFEDKGLYFMRNFLSEDTTLVRQAIASIEVVCFDAHHLDSLRYILERVDLMRRNTATAIRLIEIYGLLRGDGGSADDLLKLYDLYAGQPALQVAVFRALSGSDSRENGQMILEIMSRELPLPRTISEITRMITPLQHAPITASTLYPAVLDYIRYPEYSRLVIEVLSSLLSESEISKARLVGNERQIFAELDERMRRQRMVDQVDMADDSPPDIIYRSRHQGSRSTSEASISEATASKLAELTGHNPLRECDEQTGVAGLAATVGDRVFQSDIVHLINILIHLDSVQLAQTDVFDRVLTGRNKNNALALSLNLLDRGAIVHDSLWVGFASEPRMRVDIYSELLERERIDLFDTTYLNPVAFAESFLHNHTRMMAEDSLTFLEKRIVTTPYMSGYICFFKYLSGRGTSRTWQLAASGIVPAESGAIMPVEPVVVIPRLDRIYDDDDVTELIDKHFSRFRSLHRKRM